MAEAFVTIKTKNFVETHFRKFHHEIRKSAQGAQNADLECGKCSLHDLLESASACPLHICDKIRDHIKLSHRHTNPSWSNTRPEDWCHSYWEIAKCYIAESETNARTTSAYDLELLELVDTVCNCKYFDTLIGKSATCERLKSQLRDILIRKKKEHTFLELEENIMQYQKALEEFLTLISPQDQQHNLSEQIRFAKQYPNLPRSLSKQFGDSFKEIKTVLKPQTLGNAITFILPKTVYRTHNFDEDAPIASTSVELPKTGISVDAVHKILDFEEKVRQQELHFSTKFPTNKHGGIQPPMIDIFYERNRSVFEKECSHICQRMKSFCPNIVDVYAAVFGRPNELKHTAFVVTVSHDQETVQLFSNLRIVMKTKDRYEAEGKIVTYSETTRRNRLCAGDQSKLKQILAELSPQLLQRHKYLNMITASGVRSRGFGKDHTIEPEVCIVLYVHAKGYIPIDEVAFQTAYRGIPVDVREGGFRCFNDTIHIGGGIYRDGTGLAGSLGGFFEHPSLGLCGITSAHVVLKPEEMRECMKDGRLPANKPNENYQIKSCEGLDIGRLVMVFFGEGNDQEAGLELAVFVVNDSLSSKEVSVTFEGIDRQGKQATFSFETGHVLGNAYFYPDYQCCKYGSSSHFTTGEITSHFDNDGLLSIKDMKFDELEGMVLHKQYEIAALSKDHPFAGPGDSGAFVYCWRSADDLVCVGMIVGGTSNGTTVVTPINTILKQLGVPKLKNFRKIKREQLLNQLNAKVDQLESRCENMQSGINQILHHLTQRGQPDN